MAHLYLDKRTNPPVWRFQYMDHTGRRISATGTTSKRETEALAQRRETHAREIRDQIIPAPKPDLLISELAEDYIAWGDSQGGHRGRPWSPRVSERHRYYLRFWTSKLNLRTVKDLKGIQPRVEAVLRKLQRDESPRLKTHTKKLIGGRAGKTLRNYADGLKSFVHWLYTREYIDADPLRGLGRFDTTPRTRRRALTAEEIQQLFEGLKGDPRSEARRLGYELALCSGLRVSELRSLRVRHLDVERGGIILDPDWTKNHNPDQTFQPLPRAFVERLAAHVKGKSLNEKLVYVARDAATALDIDLNRAGLMKWGPGGKVDFHALRVAYITHVIESGADIKTAQTLARHSSPQLTLNIYTKARPERLRSTVEQLGALLPCASGAQAEVAHA